MGCDADDEPCRRRDEQENKREQDNEHRNPRGEHTATRFRSHSTVCARAGLPSTYLRLRCACWCVVNERVGVNSHVCGLFHRSQMRRTYECLLPDGTTAPCGPGVEQCVPYTSDWPLLDLPRFHLLDPSCVMNDPNGPVYEASRVPTATRVSTPGPVRSKQATPRRDGDAGRAIDISQLRRRRRVQRPAPVG
jgi:hypothetical protein